MITMKPSFWKALEALGAAGAALGSWRHHLGADWEACAALLGPTGRVARNVVDPRRPGRRLAIVVDGEDDHVAIDPDDPGRPPLPLAASEAAELSPRWHAVARALASAIGFDHGAWENEGQVRRVGSLQDPFGHVRPVLLFLPAGHLGDHAALSRSLAARTDATVLLPSARWITGDVESLGERNGLAFVDLAERLAQAEAGPAACIPLPAAGRRRDQAAPPARAVIRAGNGLVWNQVAVEVGANRTLHLRAPGQEAVHRFPPGSRLKPDHPLGILMHLAVRGEWRNPPASSPDYERVSKAFRRLRGLLQALVPLPGDPFRKERGSYFPKFALRLDPDIIPDAPKMRSTTVRGKR